MSDDPSQDLINAVMRGDLKNVESLIKTYGLSYSEVWSNGYYLLCQALEIGRQDVAELLLKCGAEVNANGKRKSDYSNTPLHLAAFDGYTEIVKMLLERNADTNALNDTYNTPLYSAAFGESPEIVKLLLDQNTRDKTIQRSLVQPLLFALITGNIDMVNVLINHGVRANNAADIMEWTDEEFTLLHLATIQQDESRVELLLNEGADVNAKTDCRIVPLHIATILKNERLVKLLLERGADVNAEGDDCTAALVLAAEYNSSEIVKILLSYKANVTVIDNHSYMPLHLAAKNNNPIVGKMLLDSGSDINATGSYDDTTALHVACEAGANDMVKFLSEQKACLDVEDKNKSSLLQYAIRNNHPDIVRTLLSLGVSIEAKDDKGKTALHVAAEHVYSSAVEVLLEYGADINATCNDSLTPVMYLFRKINEIVRNGIGIDDDGDDDGDDDNSDNVEKLALLPRIIRNYVIFQEHMTALKGLDFYVSEMNLGTIDDDDEHHDILNNHRTEVADMKATKIGNSIVTFYDVLNANMHKLVSYARNDSIVKVLESKDLSDKFPTYSRMITRSIEQGLRRKKLINSSLKSLSGLCGRVLPNVLAIELVKYFSNKDLENLINADPSENKKKR